MNKFFEKYIDFKSFFLDTLAIIFIPIFTFIIFIVYNFLFFLLRFEFLESCRIVIDYNDVSSYGCYSDVADLSLNWALITSLFLIILSFVYQVFTYFRNRKKQYSFELITPYLLIILLPGYWLLIYLIEFTKGYQGYYELTYLRSYVSSSIFIFIILGFCFFAVFNSNKKINTRFKRVVSLILTLVLFGLIPSVFLSMLN